MELRGVAHLGVHHPVGGEVLDALAGDPVQPLHCLHHDQRLGERLEVTLERSGVGAVAEPAAELTCLVRRQPLITDGVGEIDDRLRSQSTVQVVMQERLWCTQQDVVGEHSGLTVNGVGAEGREADGDVLGTLGPARVANPLTGPGEDRLTGVGRRGPPLVIDDDSAFQDQRDLVEVRRLERFTPVGRGGHVGD